jgi:hypothetical protein
MKKITLLLKALSFFLAFLFANSIYSQGTPCGLGYSITVAYVNNCNYTFTPSLPGGAPAVDWYHWTIGSPGSYGITCDTFATSAGAPTLNYSFCFSGNQVVTLFINFQNGTTCYVQTTVNVTCTSGIGCDPDVQSASIPDPLVEITYVGPDYTCGNMAGSGWHGSACMYQAAGGGGFDYACGWKWNVRIVPSTANCEYFLYHMQYIESSGGPGGNCDSSCRYITLTPGTDYCISAKIRESIVIWADGAHCCIPASYQTGYIWTPTPNCGQPGTICGPTGIVGVCGNSRCPLRGNCTENQTAMNNTSLPLTHCFTGPKRTEQRISSILNENANIEQFVLIYNVQGDVVYKGKWKFGEASMAFLNWPSGIPFGLYFVRFQNSKDGVLSKLFKLN